MYYNIHTHHDCKSESFCLRNMHQDFGINVLPGAVSMGLHPWYLSDAEFDKQFLELSNNVSKPEVVAIGECGLDRLTTTNWELQLKAFRRQINLAEEVGKPLIIHCVKAYREVLFELRSVKTKIIFHGINNKLTKVRPIIDSEHYLSFGKSILSSNPQILETFIKTPLEQVFLETDDLVNDISEIYKMAAAVRQISEDELVSQLENNFLNVFGS